MLDEYRNTLAQWLDAAGAASAAQGLDQGLVLLQLDGLAEPAALVHPKQRPQRFDLYMAIASLPADTSANGLRRLLAANLATELAECTLGLEADTGALFLRASVAIDGLTQQGFLNVLSNLGTRALDVKRRVDLILRDEAHAVVHSAPAPAVGSELAFMIGHKA